MKRILSFLLIVFLSNLVLNAASTNVKIDSLKRVLRASTSATDSIAALNQLGYEHWTVAPQQSIVFGRAALKSATRMDLPTEIAFAYRVIGVAYWALGDYPIALQNMLSSVNQYKSINDKNGLGSMSINMALVFSDQGNFREAKRNLVKAQAIFKELAGDREIATCKTKMATILIKEDSLDKAGKLLFEALEVRNKLKFRYGISECYNRLGLLYCAKGDYNASLDYLYRSRDLSESIFDKDGLAKCLGDIGYTKLASKAYNEAFDYFKQSLMVARSISSKKWRLEALNGMAKVYEAQNEHEKALQFLIQYQSLRDSLLSQQQIIAVSNLREEFKTRQQLDAIKDSKTRIAYLQDKAIQKNYLIALIILLLGALVYLFILRTRNFKLKHEQQQLALKAQEAAAKQLERELELSQRELTSYALNFVQKNEFIQDLKQEIDGMDSIKDMRKLSHKLHQANTLDSEWDKFRAHFEKVHGSFFDKLKERHPKLNQNELRHCALIRIKLNVKESAAILGITAEGAKTARYRIKKKLELEANDSLFDYLLSPAK
ncbi:MAG: tetratricopeptide repeat protein [Bacteroidia bacterium]